ncbi:predicted protein [Neisseria gonorrhoeae SK-93-1035]|nr:predicted protein [Neisseria gonorrhoeae SK-93-1035]
MPGCVIILPQTIPPKTVFGRLDLSFGIFARRGGKYSCFSLHFRTCLTGSSVFGH